MVFITVLLGNVVVAFCNEFVLCSARFEFTQFQRELDHFNGDSSMGVP
jgi:hypothetical protein